MKNKLLIAGISLTFCLNLALFAQAKEESKSGAESTSKLENSSSDPLKLAGGLNNLDRAENYSDSKRLLEKNLENIHLLHVMTQNFGSDKKSDFDKIKADYINAKQEFYQLHYINSINLLKTNEKEINKLLLHFTQVYKSKTFEILKKCAVSLTEIEVNELSSEPGSSQVNLNKLIDQSKHRLKVAYDQVRQASYMKVDNYYWESIKHYRVAKELGIKILIELAKDEDARKKVATEYKVDRTDNRNYIAKK